MPKGRQGEKDLIKLKSFDCEGSGNYFSSALFANAVIFSDKEILRNEN